MSFNTIVSLLLLAVSLCGSPTTAVETRIVNGTTAVNGRYPYMVSIRITGGNHFCGGSILNARWILTAAHCFDAISNFIAVVGTNTLNAGGDIYQVASKVQHPSYNPFQRVYDAGIFNTATTITFSSTVKAVTLAAISPIANSVAVIIGWGYNNSAGPALANQLQAVNTTVISQTQCKNQFSSTGFTPGSTHICTFVAQAGACDYDDGGPLLLGNIQFGIISIRVCGQNYADVHTRISSVYVWIKSKI